MFKFIFELMIQIETQGKYYVLRESIDITDIKQETALLKAVRTQQTEIVNLILSVIGPDNLIGY